MRFFVSGCAIAALAAGVWAGCKGSVDSESEPPGVVRVLAEREITTTGVAQTITLYGEAGGGDEVLMRLPAAAAPAGTVVRARVVAVNPQIGRAPVRAQAVEVTPASLVFQRPVLVRRRAPAMQPPQPGVRRRRVAVRLDEQGDDGLIFRARQPARRVGLPTPKAPESNQWEIDISGGGLWGLSEIEEPANTPLPGGGTLLDDVEIPFNDEEQTVYLGAAPNWLAFLIPPAPAPSAPSRSPISAQLSGARPAPVTIQAVIGAPMRSGPAPFAGTVFRVSTAAVAEGGAMASQILPRPAFRVHVPVPPLQEGYVLSRVKSPDDGAAWEAEQTVSVPQVESPIDPAPQGVTYHELFVNPDELGYFGLAQLAPQSPAMPEPKPALLSTSVATVDLGSAPVGQMSAVQTVTVRNNGEVASGVVQVALEGAQASLFAIASNDCSQALAANASCEVSVQFAPDAAGNAAATLAISAAPGGRLEIGLVGRGQAPGSLVFAPTSHDFGGLEVGEKSGVQSFALRNPGDLPSGAVSIGLTGVNQGAFEISDSTCSAALPAGASCTVEVLFAPSEAGAAAASLQASASPGGATTAALMGLGQSPAVLVSSATSLGFGGVLLGQSSLGSSLTVNNTGDVESGTLSVSLSGDHASDFTVSQDSCDGSALAGGADCSLTVEFAPGALGGRQAVLTVAGTPGGSASVTLGGTGQSQASVNVSPSVKAFTDQILGVASATQIFVVRNGGDEATGVPSVTVQGTNAGDFEIVTNRCTAGLAKDATCEVTARFKPNAAGNRVAALTVATAPGGIGTAALSGLGLAPAALSIDATAASFGSVPTGLASDSQLFTIRNEGDVATGVPVVGIEDSGAFEVVASTCGFVIAPKMTCTVGVRFAPTAIGAASADLVVTASPGGEVEADLDGTGVAPASLSVDATALSFGSLLVDVASNESQVTVTNEGAVVTGTVGYTVSGADAADFAVTSQCTTLGPDASCALGVVFTPSAAGQRSATLTITASPGGSRSVSLSGLGQTPALLTASATEVNFGAIENGKTAPVSLVTIGNSGGSLSGIPVVSISGANAADFLAVSNGCSAALPTSSYVCEISVMFEPSVLGSRSATLTVSATPGGVLNIPLSGVSGGPPALSISPEKHDFGTFKHDDSSDLFTFTIENTGGSVTPVLSYKTTGPFGQTASPQCVGKQLQPGETCTIAINFYNSQFSATGVQTGLIRVQMGSSFPPQEAVAELRGTSECIDRNPMNHFPYGHFDSSAAALSQWSHDGGESLTTSFRSSDRHGCGNSGSMEVNALAWSEPRTLQSPCFHLPPGKWKEGGSIKFLTTPDWQGSPVRFGLARFSDAECSIPSTSPPHWNIASQGKLNQWNTSVVDETSADGSAYYAWQFILEGEGKAVRFVTDALFVSDGSNY